MSPVFRAAARDRFSYRVRGQRQQGPGGIRFDSAQRFYQCPACKKKTRIDSAALDVFNPPPSVFDDDLQARFGPCEQEGFRGTFDFYCRGCGRPRRILYETSEQGMGGRFSPVLQTVLELAGDC